MNLIQIFSTPIWESSFQSFEENKQIFVDRCLDIQKEQKNLDVTNLKTNNNLLGFQSSLNLTKEEIFFPVFEFVCQIARKAVFDMQLVDSDVYLTSAWININSNKFAILCEHVHYDTFSGVFYIQIPKNSGKLVIKNSSINPMWQGNALSENKNKFNSEKIKIEPTEGHIFVWPSYLEHSVEPNNHDENRISLSFNIIALPKGTKIPKE